MTQFMLTLSITALLAIFTMAGWALHWLWTRAARRSGPEAARHQALVAKLHAAELARDTAERALAALQAAESETLGEDAAALTARLSASEAQLQAMETALQQGREEAEKWRLAYEAVISEDREDP